MRVYRLDIRYDENSESPWHSLSHRGSDVSDLWVLGTPNRLSAIWRPPVFEVERESQNPDFFYCYSDWAVSENVVNTIGPKLGEDIEFLPIDCDYEVPLYLLHVTQRVALGPEADASINSVSKNMTWINRYHFVEDDLASMKLFSLYQVPGSAAALAGLSFGTVYAAGDFAEFLDTCNFKGLALTCVFDSAKQFGR